MHDQAQTPDPQTTVLRGCAAIELATGQLEELARAAATVPDWEGFAGRAETHGLAPLVYRHLREAAVSLPTRQGLQLRALTLRHRRSDEIRSRALREVVDAFENNHIQTIILKGAALSHLIYSTPELRPMSDLDVLVPYTKAGLAQQTLKKLGYSAPAQHPAFIHHHHHLPTASRKEEGLQVSIEVHHDALTGDVPASIRFENFVDEPQQFELLGRPAFALGHIDMLRHLCHHTFEPTAEIKLLYAADIFGYATRFVDDIDWDFIENRYPFVISTLRCLYYLAPLPQTLREKIGPIVAPAPDGVGYGLRPISQTINKTVPLKQMFRRLFYPSDWWLHAYYGVAPGEKLWPTRWTTHPARVARWLWRRLRASLAHRLYDHERL